MADIFAVVADHTRRELLGILLRRRSEGIASGDASVSELVAELALSQPTVSKHLKVLENAGLIEGGRDAQRRPRKLVPQAMKELADWIDMFRTQWEQRFNNLEAHILDIQNGEK